MNKKRRDRIRRCAARQNGLCFYCDQPLDGTTNLDHVIPRVRKRARLVLAASKHSNLVAAHRACNHAKGRRLPTRQEVRRFHKLYGVPVRALLLAMKVARLSDAQWRAERETRP